MNVGHELGQQVLDAACASLRPFVAGLARQVGGDPEVSSGVFVRQGERYFIATAGHCVESLHPDEPLLLGKTEVGHHEPLRKIPAYRLLGAKVPDLALIEVPAPFAQSLGASWLDPGRIVDVRPDARTSLLVLGFPVQGLRVLTQSTACVIPPACFVGPLTERRPDPSLLRSPLHHDADLFIEFHFRESTILKGPEMPADGLDVRGMSGGGIFLVTMEADRETVWDPGTIKLVGIQVSQIKGDHLIRGVRAGYLTEMLRRATAQPTALH